MKDQYIEAVKSLLDLSTTSSSISSVEEFEKVDEIFKFLKKSISSEGVREVCGWYIPHIQSIRVNGTDLLEIDVFLRHSNGEEKNITDTLNPPVDVDANVLIEEHGGQGRTQQAIVLTISGETKDGRGSAEACIQLEIDYKTGEFKDASLHDWDVDLEDDQDEEE